MCIDCPIVVCRGMRTYHPCCDVRMHYHVCAARFGTFEAQDGWTALIYAAVNCHADCVRLLLNAGAEKEVKDVVRASCHRVCGWARVIGALMMSEWVCGVCGNFQCLV